MLKPVKLWFPPALRTFCFAWILLLVLYWPAREAGFYLDFHGLLENYKRQSFADFVNRAGIPNQSFYQLTQLMLYGLVSLFGTHPLPWFFLFITLQAAAAQLLFQFVRRLWDAFGTADAHPGLAWGIALFLVSPVCNTVLVWKACFHYLTAICAILLILIWYLKWLRSGNGRYLAQLLGLFLLSTLTLELFYLTPVFVCGTAVALFLGKAIDRRAFFGSLKKAVLPLAGIWFAYLGAYRLIYGKFVAHYEFHLLDSYRPDRMVMQLSRFLLRVFVHEDSFPERWREPLYSALHHGPVQIATGLLVFGLVAFSLVRFRRFSAPVKTAALLYVFGIGSLLLVVPMWIGDSMLLYSNNYYYLASAFLLPALAVWIVRRAGPWPVVAHALLGIYFLVSVYQSGRVLTQVRHATDVFYGVLRNFRWHGKRNVVILAMPNNLRGIGIIPSNDRDSLNRDAFNAHLYVFRGDSLAGDVRSAASFNMVNPTDGAHVTMIDSVTARVTLNQWGTWWWYSSLGALPYENELYRLELTDPGHEYFIHFKKKPSDYLLLCTEGDRWKEIDQAAFGKEQ